MTESKDAPLTCHVCGCSSTLREAFIGVPHHWHGRIDRLCPVCHERRRLRWAVGFQAFALLICTGVALRGGSGAAVGINYLLWVVFVLLMIPAHELGHALAALLTRQRLLAIRLGTGPRLASLWWGRVRLELRLFLESGSVHAFACDTSRYRLRTLIFVGAGPAVHVALLGLTLCLVPLDGVNPLREPAPGFMFGLVNAAMLFGNLRPRSIPAVGRSIASDGLTLWRTSRMTEAQLREDFALSAGTAAILALERERHEEAGLLIAEGLAAAPTSVPLRQIETVQLLAAGQPVQARQAGLALLDTPELDPAIRALTQNNIAYTNLVLGQPELRKEALGLSQRAMEALPWLDAVRGTRGSALAFAGRPEEAEALLREVPKEKATPSRLADRDCALAVAAARLGRPQEARALLDAARRRAPRCAILEAAEAAVADPPPQAASEPERP